MSTGCSIVELGYGMDTCAKIGVDSFAVLLGRMMGTGAANGNG
jgi:hypothetical protein